MNRKLPIVIICLATIVIVVLVNVTGQNEPRALPIQNPVSVPEFQKNLQPPRPIQNTSPSALESGFGTIVTNIRPSVVSIHAQPEFNQPGRPGMQILGPFPGQRGWVGSGIIIDPSGYILSTRQVIGNADRVRVQLFRAGNNHLTASRVATDKATDLVLLKTPFAANLPHAHLGDSTRVRTGDIVLAVGSPFGLAETVTHGIVSANRKIGIREGEFSVEVIQTDAPINQGNCGGPLVDIHAQVIGINMAIYSTDTTFSGIGFAVASNRARDFISTATQNAR